MLSLSDLADQVVILAFYPADWSPVCGDQMTVYNEILAEFHNHGAELIGISVDSHWCHAAFAKDRHLHFPLAKGFANGLSSSSTSKGRSFGAISRPLPSI